MSSVRCVTISVTIERVAHQNCKKPLKWQSIIRKLRDVTDERFDLSSKVDEKHDKIKIYYLTNNLFCGAL